MPPSDELMPIKRDGRTIVWRWFSREQWGRLHGGEQKDRMLDVWDELVTWWPHSDRRDNYGTVELLLSHEVLITGTGASQNETDEAFNQ